MDLNFMDELHMDDKHDAARLIPEFLYHQYFVHSMTHEDREMLLCKAVDEAAMLLRVTDEKFQYHLQHENQMEPGKFQKLDSDQRRQRVRFRKLRMFYKWFSANK